MQFPLECYLRFEAFLLVLSAPTASPTQRSANKQPLALEEYPDPESSVPQTTLNKVQTKVYDLH